MFVHPSQVAAVVARHPEIARARLVVGREGASDRMVLRCELAAAPAQGLADAVAASIREVCNLRGEVEFVGGNELPNDGKVIEDTRALG